MSKSVYFSALTFVTLSSFLGAWGQASAVMESQQKAPLDKRFPLSPDQSWAVSESLLVWKAYEDAIDYGLRTQTETVDSSAKSKIRLKHPSFDWGTGVRLKLTRYLSNDPWDIDIVGTYYYSDGENETKVKPGTSLEFGEKVDSITSVWDYAGTGVGAKAKANVRLNFLNFDLLFGRNYCLTRKVDIHPFIGIRSVLLYQDYKARYFSRPFFIDSTPLANTSFKGEHNFWGVGPRLGANLVMHFGRHWSFLAQVGGSLFAGRSNVNEKFLGHSDVAPAPLDKKVKDREAYLRSNVDASIGLGWEKWVRNRTVRIAPSFEFEVSEWFAIKRWTDLHSLTNFNSASSIPAVHSHRRYSDLGLMGFNVNLQVDF